MQVEVGAIDVNSLLSAIIGASAAILAVYVAATRERIARQAEEKARFQRETLIELQDTLQTFFRESYSLHLWQTAPKRWEEDSKEFAKEMAKIPGLPEELKTFGHFDHQEHSKKLLKDGHLASWTDARFRMESLAARIDNPEVRAGVAEVVSATRPILSQDVFDASKPAFTRLTDLIGSLIREGELTAAGFIVRAKPGGTFIPMTFDCCPRPSHEIPYRPSAPAKVETARPMVIKRRKCRR